MTPFGGYIGWEGDVEIAIHKGCLRLNSGRYALQYILEHLVPEKIYIPYYSCDSIIEVVEKLGVPFEYVKLEVDFRVDFRLKPGPKEFVLLIDYFGVNRSSVRKDCDRFSNVIVDLTQSFFEPLEHYNYAFNSARKFFGVPDGAFVSKLKAEAPENSEMPQSLLHLYLKNDSNRQKGYVHFLEHEDSFKNSKPKKMSALSERLLKAEDMVSIKQARMRNFNLLHKAFGKWNDLDLVISTQAPLCYPLLIQSGSSLKKKLLEEKIYLPTFWPEVLRRVDSDCFEFRLTQDTLCLPIDQRYSPTDMMYLIDVIKGHLIL